MTQCADARKGAGEFGGNDVLLPRPILLLVFLASILMSGCHFGSASMRVEVEVYKGPLTKEPAMQMADLVGFLREVKHGLEAIKQFVIDVVKVNDYTRKGNSQIDDDFKNWCDYDPSGINPLAMWNKYRYSECTTLKSISQDVEYLIGKIEEIDFENQVSYATRNREGVLKALEEISIFAGDLRKKAFRKAVVGTAIQPFNLSIRVAMVHFSTAVAEFGNQLHAKADALMKQISNEGYDRRELPLSVLISDTEATDFVNLYDYWDANFSQGFDPFRIFGNRLPVNARIKLLDRLFGDHNWSNVNTVYASGIGKVRMALIKDDIGNWNLKSFDSDPEELLQAYGNLAKTVLAKAAELAGDLTANAATGGGSTAIKQLLKVAQRSAFPTTNSAEFSNVASGLDELRTTTKAKLETVAEKAKKDEKGLDSQALRNRRLKLVEEIREIIRHHANLNL